MFKEGRFYFAITKHHLKEVSHSNAAVVLFGCSDSKLTEILPS